jgi:signal transduction histidine kinase
VASLRSRGSSAGATGLGSLTDRALSWWALAGLGYRVAVTPAIITSTVATLGSAATRFVWALGAVLVVDVLLLGGVAAGRLRWLLRSNAFLAWEIVVAVMLNLWMSLAMPPGTFALGGHDAFWWYAMGTVALWTGLRGARTGAAMVAGAGVLELAMFRVNGTPLDPAGWIQLLLRYAWMCTAFGGAVVVMGLARRGARLAVAAGLRAGQAAQRADMLRQMHDTVLQTLEGLALRLGSGRQSPEERLREARAVALTQAEELQAMLRADTAGAQPGLDARLQALRHDFQRRGLRVDLATTDALGPDPPRQVLEAVEGAVREALTNVAKHAGVATVAVRAAITADGIQVSVSDRGRGFDPAAATAGYGLARSIRARMAEAGGTVAVWSAPGRGTRIRLRVDTTPVPPAGANLTSRWARLVAVRFAGLQASVAGAPSAASTAAAQTFGWFAVAVLAYRVAVVPITAFNFLADAPGQFPPATLAVVLGLLLIANLTLLVGSLTGRLRGLLESNALLGVDVGVAVAVSLWAGTLIRPGSFYLMGRDVFLVYVLSVVVLWTTLRGARTGLVLLGGAALVELLTGVVNGVALDAIDWSELLNRVSTSCLAVVLPLVVMAFARQGGRLQAAEGLRAGRETERARLLRDTNELALHTLQRIAGQADAGGLSSAERLREVRALARDQAAELRAVLQAGSAHPGDELVAGLRALAAAARRDGLAVELVISQLHEPLPHHLSAALLDAAGQALAAAARPANATRAVVHATSRPDGIQITIRDYGTRVDPAADPGGRGSGGQRLGGRLGAIGGQVQVWSAPGRGTRVTLWAPS